MHKKGKAIIVESLSWYLKPGSDICMIVIVYTIFAACRDLKCNPLCYLNSVPAGGGIDAASPWPVCDDCNDIRNMQTQIGRAHV